MRRTPLRQRSPRGKLIKQCDDLLRGILLIRRGANCELCGVSKERDPSVGLFHILPKGMYPRLRFHNKNLLLACWWKCHEPWHSDYFIAKDIYKKIQALRGEHFEIDLKVLERMQPKLTLMRVKDIKLALQLEHKQLRKETP